MRGEDVVVALGVGLAVTLLLLATLVWAPVRALLVNATKPVVLAFPAMRAPEPRSSWQEQN